VKKLYVAVPTGIHSVVHTLAVVREIEARFGPIVEVTQMRHRDLNTPKHFLFVELLDPRPLHDFPEGGLNFEISIPQSLSRSSATVNGGPSLEEVDQAIWGDLRNTMPSRSSSSQVSEHDIMLVNVSPSVPSHRVRDEAQRALERRAALRNRKSVSETQAGLETEEDVEIAKVLRRWQGFYGGFEPLHRQYKRSHEDEETIGQKDGAEGGPFAEATSAPAVSSESGMEPAAPLSLADYWKQKRHQDTEASSTPATSPFHEHGSQFVNASATSSPIMSSSSGKSSFEPTSPNASSAPLATPPAKSPQTVKPTHRAHAASPSNTKRGEYYKKVVERERRRQEEAKRQAKNRSSSFSIFSKRKPEVQQGTNQPKDSASAYSSGLSGLANWFRGAGPDKSSANKH